ncbi:MAG TPA: hypothetical protein PKW35_23945 [Nannocystaceae bacterium]|nr:hypothetical protein [Nannocystaceae bacterium]
MVEVPVEPSVTDTPVVESPVVVPPLVDDVVVPPLVDVESAPVPVSDADPLPDEPPPDEPELPSLVDELPVTLALPTPVVLAEVRPSSPLHAQSAAAAPNRTIAPARPLEVPRVVIVIVPRLYGIPRLPVTRGRRPPPAHLPTRAAC